LIVDCANENIFVRTLHFECIGRYSRGLQHRFQYHPQRGFLQGELAAEAFRKLVVRNDGKTEAPAQCGKYVEQKGVISKRSRRRHTLIPGRQPIFQGDAQQHFISSGIKKEIIWRLGIVALHLKRKFTNKTAVPLVLCLHQGDEAPLRQTIHGHQPPAALLPHSSNDLFQRAVFLLDLHPRKLNFGLGALRWLRGMTATGTHHPQTNHNHRQPICSLPLHTVIDTPFHP